MATTRKTTTTSRTRKPSTKSTAAKATPEPAPAPEPTVVTVSEPVLAAADLKKKELIDMVVERSEIKKKFAKPVVEAMLEVLGETIASGRELNLQPMGKLRINRTEEKSNGRIIVCKFRQSLSGTDADDVELHAAE